MDLEGWFLSLKKTKTKTKLNSWWDFITPFNSYGFSFLFLSVHKLSGLRMIEALYTQIYAVIESSSIILSFSTKGYAELLLLFSGGVLQ